MNLHELKPAEGSKHRNKRVGRGPGSGHGKTSCRGHKGQKARSGGSVKPGFEGGQMPLHRRLPKRGFNNPGGICYSVINLKDIEAMGVTEVTPESLLGKVSNFRDGLKVLGTGELTKAVKVKAHAFSASAIEKIKKAGGTAEVIE